jgi:CMP-N-acetylneuraminic acid synthetase
MKISAYIPIKQHSSRVPRKNFKIINEQPLYFWIISKLETIDNIDEIVINTDSSELITGLDKYNFKKLSIIKREKSLQGDDVSVNLIIENDLELIKNRHILQTHVTNPLVKISTLERSIETYQGKIKEGFDSLFSVIKYQKRFYDQGLRPINHDPKILLKTQDLPPLFVENSCIYIFSKDSFNRSKARIGSHPFLFEMSEYEAFDIDWPEDFDMVKRIFSTYD